MKPDFLLRLCPPDHVYQARAEPLRMSRFVAPFGNVTESRLREMREVNFWQPGEVSQRRAHHRTHHGPRCGYPVAREVIKQFGHANVVGPSAHLEQFVVK